MPKNLIRNDEEKTAVEKVVSLLEHKIKKGIATEEEIAQHKAGVYDLLIHDWGTDSYQSKPSMIEVAAEKRRTLIAPAPKKLPPAAGDKSLAEGRPELTRKPGRFAV